MNKINSLEIKGLKSYSSETSISLSKLNVFAGVNSAGKSTAIQSLLLMRLLFENMDNHNKLEAYLNSEQYGLEMGTYNSLISGDLNFFELGLDKTRVNILPKQGDSLKIMVDGDTLFSKDKYNMFTNNFYYLSAERNGPRDFQFVDSLGIDKCGIRGEYSFHILHKYADELVDDNLLFDSDINKANKTLKKQVEAWINQFFEGVEFNSVLDEALRLVKLQVKQKEQDMGYVSLNNVGFGLAYVLPIILSCLKSPKESLIIIENPEAHLHPKGQSLLGQFLAKVSGDSRQVIIETHSEHIINGMRLYALKNQINPQDISINFFSINDGSTQVQKIDLNNDMEMLTWPEDFFDQQEIDLGSMRRIRRRNGKL